MASAWGASFGICWGSSWGTTVQYASAPNGAYPFVSRHGSSHRVGASINDRTEPMTDARINQVVIERLSHEQESRRNELMAARPIKQTGKRNAVQSRSRS